MPAAVNIFDPAARCRGRSAAGLVSLEAWKMRCVWPELKHREGT